MTIRMTSPPKITPTGTCESCGAEYVWDQEDTRTITRRTQRRTTSGLYREGDVLTVHGIRCTVADCPGLVPLDARPLAHL